MIPTVCGVLLDCVLSTHGLRALLTALYHIPLCAHAPLLPNARYKQIKTEAAKTAKREVRRGERDIDKEIRNVERSEKSLISEIRKTAKGGNQVSAQPTGTSVV